MMELSPLTRQHVAALFAAADVAEAERLLVSECGANLPLIGDATPTGLERIRFAALRLSEGAVPRLRDAIALAQADWRDLLVAADFGDDVDAHLSWQPRRLDPG